MEQALVVLKRELGRGGALCKEFNRSRLVEGMNWRAEMHYALGIIEGTDPGSQLRNCTADSVGRALIDLGVMGLTLSPAMKLAYLIPYSKICTVSPSYMGLEQMAYRTGFVEGIQCVLVRTGDKFEVWADDDGRHIRHTEAIHPKVRGDVTHAYCIAWFSSGKRHIEVMDKKEILACKDAATKKNKGKVPFTWIGAFRGEMYKKCVLRRGWKHWPKVDNPRLVAMMDAVNRTDPLEFEAKDSVVEESPTINGDQIDSLVQMMVKAGVPDRGHDVWLQGLAKAAGYPTGIRHVRKEDFEALASRMQEGLDRWQSQQSATSTASSSEPDGSMRPKEAA